VHHILSCLGLAGGANIGADGAGGSRIHGSQWDGCSRGLEQGLPQDEVPGVAVSRRAAFLLAGCPTPAVCIFQADPVNEHSRKSEQSGGGNRGPCQTGMETPPVLYILCKYLSYASQYISWYVCMYVCMQAMSLDRVPTRCLICWVLYVLLGTR
jgi:hypothetical protein